MDGSPRCWGISASFAEGWLDVSAGRGVRNAVRSRGVAAGKEKIKSSQLRHTEAGVHRFLRSCGSHVEQIFTKSNGVTFMDLIDLRLPGAVEENGSYCCGCGRQV